MANEEHLRILRQGSEVWNKWRNENPKVEPDLSEADLRRAKLVSANLGKTNLKMTALAEAFLYDANLHGADLHGANLEDAFLSVANFSKADLRRAIFVRANLDHTNLREADLREADLSETILRFANLSEADLRRAKLVRANLDRANLTGADLRGAYFNGANLSKANLCKADLTRGELINALLVETNLENTNLIGCYIYGISARNLKVNEETKQSGLIITQYEEPTVTVDDLEVAQFIYLLLNRQKLRNIIDTITSKAVLILGRFTPERKAVLDAMANELRKNNLLPIIFDFERATSRDFTETIKTLAGLSLFVIADITNPKSAPLELQATIPDYQIPFVPIIEEGEKPFSMFDDLKKYTWVLKILPYPSLADLMKGFKKAIIDEAFEMHKRIIKEKAAKLESRSLRDYLGEK